MSAAELPSRHCDHDDTWRERAACHGVDPLVFFPDFPEDVDDVAAAYCDRCPVRPRCQLETGPAVDGVHAGVWWARTPTATTGRLPWEPLWTWLLARVGLPAHREACPCGNGARGVCYGYNRAAADLGVDIVRIRAWRRHGLLPDQADRICDQHRVHPTEVWGMAYYELGLLVCRCGDRFAATPGQPSSWCPECRATISKHVRRRIELAAA